jgi:hypothetical protein
VRALKPDAAYTRALKPDAAYTRALRPDTSDAIANTATTRP